jgi:hypothetical protein
VLDEVGPRLALPETPGLDQHGVQVVPLGGGPEVVVAFGLHEAGESPGAIEPLGDVVVDPWGAWPPEVAFPHQLSATGGEGFVIGAREDPSISMITAAVKPESSGLFAPSVDPMGTANLVGISGYLVAGTPRFITQFAQRFVVGFDNVYDAAASPPLHLFNTFVVLGSGDNWIGTHTCGRGALGGDAVPTDTGFVAALATSPDNPGCEVTAGGFMVSGASHLRTVSLVGDTDPPPTLDEVAFPGAIDRLRLVPRTSGTWVVLQTRGDDGSLGPIALRRLDANGKVDPAFAPADAVPAGSHGFAAAPLGDGLALAWIDAANAIGVAVFDAQGVQRAETSLSFEGTVSLDEPLAVVTASDGSSIVVGWSEQAPGTTARVRLAKLGCIPNG